MKPILFNTEMVRAILDGRKTVTRRVVKHYDITPLSICRPKLYTMVEELNGRPFFGVGFYRDTDVFFVDGKQHIDAVYFRAPYRPGDILYVRETWAHPSRSEIKHGADSNMYLYKADDPLQLAAWDKWRPSIHMPRGAARLFLRVTNVRVERLNDITLEDCLREGITWDEINERDTFFQSKSAKSLFETVWDSTMPKHPNKFKRYPYYWNDNPWVWVIEFERISKDEVLKGDKHA